MGDMEREVLVQAESLSDELVELCRSLVQINTVNPYSGGEVTGLERDGQMFLKPILEGMGAKVRLFEPPDGIYEKMGVLGPKDRNFKDRPNLVAEFDLGSPGKRIIVNGHMDTVAVSDMPLDPFGAGVRDGRIWGRGTSDCKGGLSVGLMAIKAALKFADELVGSIVYESVVDEESNGSGAGTLACCYEGYRGDMALVVDGNDLDITLGCGGCLTADVTVTGRAGHAAGGGGVSAIDKALIVKAAIDQFKEERESRFPDCKVNLGVFNAGVHPAVVPGGANLSLNIVYKLEEAAESEGMGEGWGGAPIRRAFSEIVREYEERDEWLKSHPSQVEWVKDLIPFETPRDADVVRSLEETFEEVLGHRPNLKAIPAWGDAAYLSRFGGMPTVMFGPGVGSACHSPEEYIEIDDMVSACKVIALFIFRQLRVDS